MIEKLENLFANDICLQILCVSITFVVFLISRKLAKVKILKYLPSVIIASFLIILLLQAFDFSYKTYVESSQFLVYLLAPATVAMAYPLYQFSGLIKFNALEIFTATFVSIFISISSIIIFSSTFGYESEIVRSIIAKCVTTPVALEITKMTGGVMGLCIISVFTQGMFGAIFGHGLFSLFRVKNDIAIGLAMGCTSHVIGTAKCISVSDKQAALSALVLVLCAIFTTLIVSFFSLSF